MSGQNNTSFFQLQMHHQDFKLGQQKHDQFNIFEHYLIFQA